MYSFYQCPGFCLWECRLTSWQLPCSKQSSFLPCMPGTPRQGMLTQPQGTTNWGGGSWTPGQPVSFRVENFGSTNYQEVCFTQNWSLQRQISVEESNGAGCANTQHRLGTSIVTSSERVAHLLWRDLPGLDNGWPGRNRELLRHKILWGNSNTICIWNLPENKLSNWCPSMKMRCNICCRRAFPFCMCFRMILENAAQWHCWRGGREQLV